MNPMTETRKTNVQLSPMNAPFLLVMFVFRRKSFVNIFFMHLSKN
ncbi:uncharacterized protein METZ01_LOCUS240566 [marine metagenome]|uniref:Uncharacterized protein n=1 Tax=marine metagenome TaxID=408172 RepID=A0A382HKP6_9ZZZZ